MKITYAQYEKYLKADNMIRTTAICQASDEAEVVVERDVILDNPTLTLEVKGWGGVTPSQPALWAMALPDHKEGPSLLRGAGDWAQLWSSLCQMDPPRDPAHTLFPGW